MKLLKFLSKDGDIDLLSKERQFSTAYRISNGFSVARTIHLPAVFSCEPNNLWLCEFNIISTWTLKESSFWCRNSGEPGARNMKSSQPFCFSRNYCRGREGSGPPCFPASTTVMVEVRINVRWFRTGNVFEGYVFLTIWSCTYILFFHPRFFRRIFPSAESTFVNLILVD